MLLYVRQPFYGLLKSGQKTVEIRAGKRYRNIRPGDKLIFNHKFSRIVTGVSSFDRKKEFLIFIGRYHREAGFDSRSALRSTFEDFYAASDGPFFAFFLH